MKVILFIQQSKKIDRNNVDKNNPDSKCYQINQNKCCKNEADKIIKSSIAHDQLNVSL